MLGLDALTGGARRDEGSDVLGQPRPPHQATGQCQRLVATEVAAERGGVQLREDQAAEGVVGGDAEPVAAGAAAVEEPLPPHIARAGGVDGSWGAVGRHRETGRRPRGGDEGGQQRVRVVGRGHLPTEVGGKETGTVRATHHCQDNTGGGGGGDSLNGEQLLGTGRVGVPGRASRGVPVEEGLAGEKVGGGGAARDVHHRELELGEEVEPPRLVAADVALLLQPLEARVVRVQREGLVQEVGPQGLERVDHRQELQHVGGVHPLRVGELARLEGHGSVVARGVGLLEDGRHGALRGVGGEARGPPRVPQLEHRR
mmetsp:Transcript_36668/g.96736  ORF Transcript_36668/g.96736 Transcript_36668/m.96736 type:complete len:314 (+) Transcript_36668:2686-3627(+)